LPNCFRFSQAVYSIIADHSGLCVDILLPEAVAGTTEVLGINPEGDIVGGYFDSSGLHGFLLSRELVTN
jgi:hypothetical protein